MNIKKEWSAHVDALEDARRQLEEALMLVPDAGTGRRCRQGVEKMWKKVVETSDAIEELIISAVQSLPVEFPWQDKEFRELWQTYKEYLEEQHHIVMESRMEAMRLKMILKFSKNKRDIAIASLEFYMSYGSSGIFPVNFNEETSDGTQPKQTVTFNIS